MTTKMVRPKRRPLSSWEDRINKSVALLGRSDFTSENDTFKMRIIRWECLINMFGRLAPKEYISIIIIPKKRVISNVLLSTEFGLVCPRCLTNEYIESQNDFLPRNLRSAKAKKYCSLCGTMQ